MHFGLCPKVVLLASVLTFSFGIAAQSASAVSGRSLQDYGLMLNEDGDIILMVGDADPKIAQANLLNALDTLKSSPIKTLVYQVGCGSDVLHYPTKVASTWGWRTTAAEQSKPWSGHMAKMRPAAAAGLDSVRVAADWCKANGRYFVPGYRMNDAHFCADPENSPLTGEFWVKNHEALELKESPVPEVESYRYLLDYTKPEVRAYRLAIVMEIIERYQDAMEGIQLDFMRHPAMFPKGTAAQNAPLLTEMIRQIRSKLDELGKKNGRSYALMMRVPPTLKHSRNVGIAVDQWLKVGLVDVVTPGPAMTVSHDMPVKEFAALAGPTGAKVYPSVPDRTQFAWPFTADPTEQSYAGVVGPDVSPQLLRGAALNYRAMGAAGVEVYNFNVPLSAESERCMTALAAPETGERIYAITPHFWIDTTDLIEPVKQIPATLESGRPARLTVYVGEDFAASKSPLRCALRLGLSTPRKPDEFHRVAVAVNGQTLYAGAAPPHYTAVTGKPSRWSSTQSPLSTGYLQFPIENLRMFKPGWNELTFEIAAKTGKARCLLSEVELAVGSAGK